MFTSLDYFHSIQSTLFSFFVKELFVYYLVIEIGDTGVGIKPDDLSKVMEAFFTTKPEGKGTGLGLLICRRIAEEHHGTFEIESEVGVGTTVRVQLPLANETNADHFKSSDE